MTKRITSMLIILCVIVALSFVLVPSVQAKPVEPTPEIIQNVTTTRFLNMLNHNYVYDDAFNYTDDIVNNSMAALLNMRDTADEDFIAEQYVRDYVNSMYGIELVDFSALNEGFPKKDGYVFILPRGLDSYTHTLRDYRENEDGSFTVTTDVVIETHDGQTEKAIAVTLFVANKASSLGYNIVYSNILSASSDI